MRSRSNDTSERYKNKKRDQKGGARSDKKKKKRKKVERIYDYWCERVNDEKNSHFLAQSSCRNLRSSKESR